jgi:hypothetical protein
MSKIATLSHIPDQVRYIVVKHAEFKSYIYIMYMDLGP